MFCSEKINFSKDQSFLKDSTDLPQPRIHQEDSQQGQSIFTTRNIPLFGQLKADFFHFPSQQEKVQGIIPIYIYRSTKY